MSAQRLRPTHAEEVRAMLGEAAAQAMPLRVVGGGTRRPLYARQGGEHRDIDLSGLTGVTGYEPEELVLSLRAGTPLDFVEDLLAERGQMLAFDPPDHARLLGTEPARTTIGGIVGSGFAGSRRLSAGNVRDHLLGFEAVSGGGELFKAGGRVIKNVTGYDLSKLVTGSWGTLAVLTELSLRVLPRPAFEATVLLEDDGVDRALASVRAVLATSLEVGCAAVLPDGRAALRLEGFRASVLERHRQLVMDFGRSARVQTVEAEASTALWRAIRNVDPFVDDPRPLWRISLPSNRAGELVAAIRRRLRRCDALFDWGGALVWLATEAEDEDAAAFVRSQVAAEGGHAWLMRAPPSLRAAMPAAPAPDAGIAALSRRVKQGFDPLNLLGAGPFGALLDIPAPRGGIPGREA